MKKYALIALLLLVSMALCPLAAMGSRADEKKEQTVPVISQDIIGQTEYITVMSSATGGMQKIGMREYLIGCVAAEMPPNYHPEALKAQAIASYSYAKRLSEKGAEFISDSPMTHQGYVSRQTRIKNWGEDFEKNEKKISEAVDSVSGLRLTYGDETALAVYHSISSGRTRSAESMWGEDIPYLRSVPSDGDRLSPDFADEKSYTADELSEKLGVEIEGDPTVWVDDVEKTDGYVDTAVICGKEFDGTEIRDSLGLRSESFEIECGENSVTFICEGHGHGVGMSQYGADYMARQGSAYTEILAHYYPDTEITA